MAGERILDGLKKYRKRYRKTDRAGRSSLLDEFCEQTGYHRKYAIALLRQPADSPPPGSTPRRRGLTYSAASVRVLAAIWKAAGYPWSVRLKALLPQWLPWARKHVPGVTAQVEAELLQMSPRQMDRRLSGKRRRLKGRIYGRTKPGTLLKHHIPIKTDNWDVHEPGYCEIDLVSHSGPHASGEFIYSLNLTDIFSGWCETVGVMGKGETGVVAALDALRRILPFPLKAIDSDNGSEFINHHLYRYCKKHGIQFTRGRPYKKDDNAHIEQKNWTHVRKLLGWDRYDTPEALAAINALYRSAWRTMMNLFQPCVKLKEKVRVGSRITRRYDTAQTPLDRLVTYYGADRLPDAVTALLEERRRTDPFTLSADIDRQAAKLTRPTVAKKAKINTNTKQFSPSPRGGADRAKTTSPAPYAW
jgi:transposase InsO family protein